VKEIGEILKAALEEGMNKDLAAVMVLRREWEEIAGAEQASSCRPYRLEGEVLYVEADSHSRAQDVSFIRERIRKGAEKVLGRKIGKVLIRVCR
jgi:predicted nucleic acid-binding Zn ribbon protein